MADPGQRTLDAPEPTDPVPEAQEQTDIDRRTTEHSFSHREARGRWGPERTALFYEGLRRWGTDFGMVATWVPGMSRNQVKRKFNMEERANLADVLDALKKENRIATTLDEIQAKRGRPLKDPGDWQRDVDRREEEMRRRARAEREEREERLRNRGQVPPTAAAAGAGKQVTPRQGGAGDDGGDDDEGQQQVATEVDESRSGGKATGRAKKKGRNARNAQPEVVNEGMF